MKAVRLHWWRGKPNFGDALSPILVERLSGCPVEYAAVDQADLLGAGSILYEGDRLTAMPPRKALQLLCLGRFVTRIRRARRPVLNVWGSGLIVPWYRAAGDELLRNVSAPCVRGRLTEQMLVAADVIRPGSVSAFGDPGLLYKTLLPGNVEKQYDIGVVPHAFDMEIGAHLHERIARTGRRAVLVDVSAEPLDVLSTIASCERIVSSSLHGCIVADSLGIPNRQVVCSLFNMTREQFFFKYRDYYSAFDEDLPTPLGVGELLNDVSGSLDGVMWKRHRSAERLLEIETGLRTSLNAVMRSIKGGSAE